MRSFYVCYHNVDCLQYILLPNTSQRYTITEYGLAQLAEILHSDKNMAVFLILEAYKLN